MSEQTQHARTSGKGLILQGDLNSWLGPKNLPGDLRPQNGNGRLFQNFLEENKLTCVNSLPLTKGLVTRRRKYLNEVRESTLDFYVVCQSVLPLIQSMEIFNHTDHNLTNYYKSDNKCEAVSSDHAPLSMEVKLEAIPATKKKIEIPNFQDFESLKKFTEATSQTKEFTDCFVGEQDVLEQCDNWMLKVSAHVKQSFKKIRIRPRKIRPSAADRLIGQKNRLLKNGKIKESEILDAQIVRIISEEGRNKANMFRKYCDRNSSNVMSEMWQMKKKMFPTKTSALPSAKLNYQGKVVTEPSELLKLVGEEFGRVRLRKRPCHPLIKNQKQIRQKLLNLKLLVAKGRKTDPFQMEDLENVLKGLKTNKARGPDGLSRAIFRNSTIGTD